MYLSLRFKRSYSHKNHLKLSLVSNKLSQSQTSFNEDIRIFMSETGRKRNSVISRRNVLIMLLDQNEFHIAV